MNAQHVLIAIVLIAGLTGLAFVGLAAGHGLQLVDPWAMARHPLFSSGAASLTSALVCALLWLRFGRGH
ncbi:hypothetical protein ACG02S_18490 [Roseateles sp. DC23W]|uniref:DUF2905 domain-containing protein n=1 Tax=Pelomonas dachongensis TaxID=3299029 RepID=A0ABW7EQV7_9BURK